MLAYYQQRNIITDQITRVAMSALPRRWSRTECCSASCISIINCPECRGYCCRYCYIFWPLKALSSCQDIYFLEMYVGAAWHHEIIMISKTTTNVTITALVIGVALNFTHRLLPSGYILHLCIITLPTTWLFGWPHKRSAYRLHLQTLVHKSSLLQYLVT